MNTRIASANRISFLVLLGFLITGTYQLTAADQSMMRVRMLWGSDNEQFADDHGNMEKVDPKLEERLKKVFRWEYYWEEDKLIRGSVPVIVAKDQMKSVRLNDKTTLNIKYLGKREMEILLLGKRDGKDEEERIVVQKMDKLVPGGLIIVAGEAQDNDAWFVIISNFPE